MHPTAARVQERLHERGLDVIVQVLPDSARTAAEAAVAVGCDVGQIVKSLVFMRDGQPVIVLCAGDRRVAAKRLGLRPANADEARAATGFAIGGIPPLGHDQPLETLIDESLQSVCDGVVRGRDATRRVRGRHRGADRGDPRWRGRRRFLVWGRRLGGAPARAVRGLAPAPTCKLRQRSCLAQTLPCQACRAGSVRGHRRGACVPRHGPDETAPVTRHTCRGLAREGAAARTSEGARRARA